VTGVQTCALPIFGLAEGIEASTGLSAEIKWPNDLVVSKRKLAGILAEGVAQGQDLQYIVLGFGVKGTGIGFFGTYVVNWLVNYAVTRRLSGFQWSRANLRLFSIFVPIVTAVFMAPYALPRVIALIFGIVATLGVGLYSLRNVCSLVPMDRLPGVIQKGLRTLRLAPLICDAT